MMNINTCKISAVGSKLLRTALAGIMMLTAAAPATAAIMYCDNAAITASAVSSQDAAKFVYELDNAALNDLAKALPLGNLIVQPIRSLLNSLYSSVKEKDPKDVMLEEIHEDVRDIKKTMRETNGRLDNISKQLSDLSNNLDTSVDWLANWMKNVVEKQSIKEHLQRINYDVKTIYQRKYAIENNSTLNDQQKLVRLAELNNCEEMKDLNFRLDVIARSMEGKDLNSYTDFFENLYESYEAWSCFNTEAFKMARNAADALTEQMMTACTLRLQCQLAVDALDCFSAEDKDALEGDDFLSRYNNCIYQNIDLESQISNNIKDLNASMRGYRNFIINHECMVPEYIDGGRISDPIPVKCTCSAYISCDVKTRTVIDSYEAAFENDVLTMAQYRRMAEHIRTAYPNTSIKTYLTDIVGMELDPNEFRDPIRMLTDTAITKKHIPMMDGSMATYYYVNSILYTNPSCTEINFGFGCIEDDIRRQPHFSLFKILHFVKA